jgi:hypothetical protein
MRRTIPRIVAAVVAVVAGTALVVLGPSSASAALPTCNHWSDFTVDPGSFEKKVPIPTTQGGSFNANCALRYGDNTWGVFALQRALNKCHGAGLVEDAVYGERTRNAVIWMQAAAGITVDGVYGPQTRELALKWPRYYKLSGGFAGCYPSPL